jgi:hypothetical protein
MFLEIVYGIYSVEVNKKILENYINVLKPVEIICTVCYNVKKLWIPRKDYICMSSLIAATDPNFVPKHF